MARDPGQVAGIAGLSPLDPAYGLGPPAGWMFWQMWKVLSGS